MNEIIRELPTFVNRTYRGGKMLREFLRQENCTDDFYPEDWITSFSEARNKEYIPNEGISHVATENGNKLITEVVIQQNFGGNRKDPGVLIKFLDAGERLVIQVHPTVEYAQKVFHSSHGKTESWHILNTRQIGNEPACIYIGFKEYVTKSLWKSLFESQDICGMLNAMHRFDVKKGDTILVTGGTPHAIGAGCFMLEVQEPSDYTMRVEKVTVAGDTLTPMQIHYGVGEEALIECFNYEPLTREEAYNKYFINHKKKGNIKELISYDDTELFSYTRIMGGHFDLLYDSYVTLISLGNIGTLEKDDITISLNAGDRFFISAGIKASVHNADCIICFPPKER